MIRVYLLPVEIIDGTEIVAGCQLIHDALLECTEDAGIRKLIQDTTPDEHDSLLSDCISWRDATQEEIDRYHAQVVITPPDPDIEKAKELLATSPPAITMPEMWELLRIFGRFRGLCD
ncbi:hypothetical protein ES703_35263 [subsurface metagenome]